MIVGLFPLMSMDQKFVILDEFDALGVDVDIAWADYNQWYGQSSLDFLNLNRRTLVEVLLQFWRNSTNSQQIPSLVEDCPGEPQRWTVVADGTHWFRGKTAADW